MQDCGFIWLKEELWDCRQTNCSFNNAKIHYKSEKEGKSTHAIIIIYLIVLLNIHITHRLRVSSTLKIKRLSTEALFLIWGCNAKGERTFWNDNQAAAAPAVMQPPAPVANKKTKNKTEKQRRQ